MILTSWSTVKGFPYLISSNTPAGIQEGEEGNSQDQYRYQYSEHQLNWATH